MEGQRSDSVKLPTSEHMHVGPDFGWVAVSAHLRGGLTVPAALDAPL